MYLASDPRNIRFNGSGRGYVAAVQGTSFDDLGELESISASISVTNDTMYTTRDASRAAIIEQEKLRNATLTVGLRELTEENLKIALLGGDFQAQNQSAGYVNLATAAAAVDDKYVDLGHLNVYMRKLTHGTLAGGSFAKGDTITGVTSSATGVVAWADGTAKIVELVNLGGGDDWIVGETIGNGTASGTLTASEKLEDIVVVDDDTPATRYIQGTDYTLDPDYGLLRILSAGAVGAAFSFAYNYEAVTKKYMHAFTAGSVERKLIFVTDKDDRGTRFRMTFWRVKINLNGDFPLLGEGAAILSVTGTLLADTAQPAGQKYWKMEAMPKAA